MHSDTSLRAIQNTVSPLGYSRYMVFLIFSLFLFLVQVSISAQGQSTFTVRGIVSAASSPVNAALVTLVNKNDTTDQVTAITDATGYYSFDVVSSVTAKPSLPKEFELSQNYPNPFVSSTAISYKLNKSSDVRIVIFDLLGREVKKFLVSNQNIGTHGITWDAKNDYGARLANGVYFYRMEAGNKTITKKMVLGPSQESNYLPAPALAFQTENTKAAITNGLMSGTYQIRVTNTARTTPQIMPKTTDNILLSNDTLINITVDKAQITATATIYIDSTQQYIRGFGAANILPWRPDMTSAQITKAFGTNDGQIGFSMLRLRVPYTDSESDFSAQVTTAKQAEALGALVFATPWTPPAALKSNNNIVGGTLNTASYATYATHLKSFVDYMSNHGAPLYAISVQNEPDANVTYESCYWNATQFMNFMRNYALSIGIKMIMPESENFNHALSDSTLNDSAACANTSIIAGHIYGGGIAAYPLAVSKGKEVWMTEYLETDTTWAGCMSAGNSIHKIMNAGMNAYVWWYIVRYYGPIDESGNVTRKGYVMSQFARFIRPGYHKIKSATSRSDVYITAAKSDSAKVAIVVSNTGSDAIQYTFNLPNCTVLSFTPYMSTSAKSCQKGDAVAVNNGSMTVKIDPQSIITLVSN